VNQTANGIITSHDVLADLLESIGRFVNRLKIYAQIAHTPVIDKEVVKLIAELISTLALVTRKLKQRGSRESLLDDVSPYSDWRSRIRKELFCGQGHKGGAAEAGPTHS